MIDDLGSLGSAQRYVVVMRGAWAVNVLVVVVVVVGGCGNGEEHADRAAMSIVETTSTSVASACTTKDVTISSVVNGIPAPPTNPDEPDALAATIAASFCVPTWNVTYPDGTEQALVSRPILTADEAACIGHGIIEGLGATRARELGVFGAAPWSLLGFGLSNNAPPHTLERAEAEQLVDTFASCTPSWELLLILSVTEGADRISDASASCVRDELSAADAREMLVGEIDRAYDDPAQPDARPFPELIQPLVDAYDACLTPAERAGLDFS